MAVDDHGGQGRGEILHSLGDLGGDEFLGLCVDDFNRQSLRRQKVAIRPAQTGFSTAVRRLPSDW